MVEHDPEVCGLPGRVNCPGCLWEGEQGARARLRDEGRTLAEVVGVPVLWALNQPTDALPVEEKAPAKDPEEWPGDHVLEMTWDEPTGRTADEGQREGEPADGG